MDVENSTRSTHSDSSSSPVTKRRSRSSLLLYQQVEQYLLEQIESGALQPGDALPSVKVLCEQFGGINHLTVRQAIRNLVRHRLVKSFPRRGSFVTTLEERRQAIRPVALMLPYLGTYLAEQIAKGVQAVMREKGRKVLVLDSQRNLEHELENIQHLQELAFDGAIILPVPDTSMTEEIALLKRHGFPFVLVDRVLHDVETPSVMVDNYGGSYRLTQHLLQQGRRHIAWVGEMRVSSAADRMAGCRDAISDAQVIFHRSLFCDVANGWQRHQETGLSGNEIALDKLLRSTPCPDAIVCGNDATAFEMLRLLKQRGLRVPADIAVTGFDDLPQAPLTDPPLSTVRQPMQEMGAEAARLLLQMIDDPFSSFEQKVLPVELVLRQSA